MLRLLSPNRDSLFAKDALNVPEALRPCTAKQIEDHNSHSPALSAQDVVRTSHPSSVRRTSLASLTTRSAYENYDVPHLTKTPWELERRKRTSIWRRAKMNSQLPTHVFKKLPREVYDCVVEQLERLHLAEDQACPSCYLKDLHSLSLTSRAWDRAATVQMYRKVRVLRNEEDSMMPKLKITGTSRLKLLRRTLRERKALARCVRELNMPDFQALYQTATIEREEIVNLVASLVMACPNLERLVGFHIPYTHSFDRLSHALSTRPQLKERVWLLADPMDSELDEEEEESPMKGYYHAACDPTERFLELNSNHPTLTTLVLHHEQGHASMDLTFRAIIGTLRQYPALSHLAICGFTATSFTNLALNALPYNLRSLRLEDLPGINDKGLQRFANSHSAITLENITLINLEVSHLTTLSNFLSPRLARLERFSFCQHRAPALSSGASLPDLESPSLMYIHWELRSQAGPTPTLSPSISSKDSASFPFQNDEPISCLATTLLALSIKKSLFPSLRKIRAPHDPQGVLQAFCKPMAMALLPSDSCFFTSLPRYSSSFTPWIYVDPDRHSTFTLTDSSSTTASSIRVDSVQNSPMSDDFPHYNSSSKHHFDRRYVTALTPSRSRLAAQSRILAARKQPFMSVKVTDPKGALRVNQTINGFLGDVSSKITYDLGPDRNRIASGEWNDEEEDEEADERVNEWITGIGDVVGEWQVVERGGLGSCRHVAHAAVGRNAVLVEDMF